MLANEKSSSNAGACDGVRPLLPPKQGGGCVLKRHIFAFLAFLGLFNVYAMRMDLSEASEPMQSHFRWTDGQQGMVLSSFFWGYFLFQIPGAIMARRWGGKRVFGIGVLGTSLLTIALPICSHRLWLLYSVRALMGLMEAVTYPALNEMLTHWAPAAERARMVCFTNAGAYLGTAVAMPVAGTLIGLHKDSRGVSDTWPIVFYVFGVVGCLWFAFWEFFVASTPAQHSSISGEERAYILATTHQLSDTTVSPHEEGLQERNLSVGSSPAVPWVAFLTHPAAWVIYINHFAYNYGCYTMMTYLPKFLDEVLGMNMKNAGFTASVPYLLMAFFTIAGGYISDRLAVRCNLRLVRLLALLLGFTCSGGLLVTLGFLTEHRSEAIVVMSLSIGLSGIAVSGFGVNFFDVCPNHAGQMYGVSNTIGNIAGIISPIVAGDILGDQKGVSAVEDWRRVFYITAGVYLVAGVLWIVFMRAKPVPAFK